MELTIEEGPPFDVTPWHPYYLDGGTQHGFHNPTDVPIEIMEIFVQ